MANPLVSAGQLNRLVASVSWATFPTLNVTASFLNAGGIDLSLDGQATQMLPAMTAAVISPEPYMLATITINLLKTQALSQLYKAQMELSSPLGSCTVRPDVTSGLAPYMFQNCAIESVSAQSYNGSTAGYTVVCRGTYYINSNLFS